MRMSDWSSDVCSSDLHLGELNVRCIGCEHHLAEGVPLVIEQVRHHGEVRRRRVARPALLRLARATFVSIGHLLGLLLPEAVCLRHPEALPARLTKARRRDRESPPAQLRDDDRSEEHTSELQSLMRISYAVFCLKKKKNKKQH